MTFREGRRGGLLPLCWGHIGAFGQCTYGWHGRGVLVDPGACGYAACPEPCLEDVLNHWFGGLMFFQGRSSTY